MRASFWFTPALIVLASMVAAVVLVDVDAWELDDLVEWSPRLFGAGADGSRAMLSAIATSMVTVAGVVFSITIVTLSLSSTQYSPRVLRNFMRDTPTQVVLGVFVGIFAYCLIVLRTIRGGDEGAFIPSLAVMGGMGYAFGGIAMLIYFIHHVAESIQASSILARITADTERAIDSLFPQQVGLSPAHPDSVATLPALWQDVPASRSGYLAAVDSEALLAFAREQGRVLRIALPVGAFIAKGSRLVSASGAEALDDHQLERLRQIVYVAGRRTVDQDAAFGLEQLVDVALRALSPGINDPTTACMCIDQIAALLARLARRDMPAQLRIDEGQLRVIAPARNFGEFAQLALDPVTRSSGGDLQVLTRLLDAADIVAAAAGIERRGQLRGRLDEIQIELAAVRPRSRSKALRRRLGALQRCIRLGQDLPDEVKATR